MKYLLNNEKKLKMLTFSILSILILFIIGLGYSQKFLINNRNNIIESIESQWRDEAKDKSKYLSQQLELSITKDELNYWDDNELHAWILENMLPMKVGGEHSNVIVANIGYSYRQWDDTNWNSIKESNNLNIDSELDKRIKKYFNENNLQGKSNTYIDDLLISFVDDISLEFSIDKEKIITCLRQVLFVKNKLLLDTDPTSIINNKFTNYKSLKDYLEKDSENFETNYERLTSGTDSKHYLKTSLETDKYTKFLEWSVVPPNKLGWELEPPHKTGVDNVGYKKIAIIVEIDKSEIFNIYNADLSRIDTFILITNVVMVAVVLIVLVSLMINFHKFLSNDK